MTTFTVEWTIEIDAASPDEAARKALAIQRDPDSTSTCFDVYADDPDEGDGYHHHAVDIGAADQPSGSTLVEAVAELRSLHDKMVELGVHAPFGSEFPL